ncbi:retention module-containing protein, partial [Pseudoalteromonas sp. SG43-7]|uniref:retention module-containing protein n=2 Tax=unclassified Pseudoalteromonas TaxID=194690 RepID=UPI0016024180
MDANQLLIIDIQGSAGIVLEDGSIRALSLGDALTVGDVIITAENSSVMIDIKGMSLSIPANQRVRITPDLVAETTRDSSETTIFDDSIDDAIASLNQPNTADEASSSPLSEDVSDFLSALESGGDLLDTLEATAAGGNAATGSGGGTSFVELARIAEGIDPSSLSFDDSFTANNDGIFSLRDTTDGVVPETALIGSLELNDIGLINNPQPIISGASTNLVGQTVLITITDALGNVQTIDVVVQPDGTFTSPELEPLPDGPIVVEVTATGPDGNPISDNIAADIDTTAPLVSIDTLADSTSPVVVITGSVVGLVAGDDVTLTVTDSSGQVQTFVTQIDEQGNWSVTTAALAEGPYGVQANVVDEAGNQGNAQTTAIIDLTAPVIVIDAIADTNDVTPTLTGSVNGVATGTLVSITVVASDGVAQALTASVTADGSWSVEVVDALAEGQFTVTASVADSAGNQAEDSAAGVVDLTSPVISIDQLNDSNDTTPLISGSVLDVPPGTTVTLLVTGSDGQQQTLTATTDGNGNWQVDVINALVEGDYTVQATVSDPAGNSSSASAVGTIDLTAPLINIDPLVDSNDQQPTISGITQGLAAGSQVTVTIVDSNGQQQTVITQINASGVWSIAVASALAEGPYTVTATTQDTAGNTAQDTETGLIDLTAPTISIDSFADSNDVTPIISGVVSGVEAGTLVTVILVDSAGTVQTVTTTVNADGSWQVGTNQAISEGEFSITASVTDTAGNQATDVAQGLIDLTAPTINLEPLANTADDTPVISGQVSGVAVGTMVTIVVTDANGVQQTLMTSVLADGGFAIEVDSALAQGSYSVTASVTDNAGNQASDTQTGLIDSSLLSVTIDVIGETNDTTPSISGTSLNAVAGDTVSVLITGFDGQTQLLTTQVDNNGDWSVTPTIALVEGGFSVNATLTDSLGNIVSDNATGIIDTTAPILTIDNLDTVSDSTPIISGQTDEPAGSVVSLVVTDGVNSQNLTAIVNTDGSWSVEVPIALQNGAINVDASITDTAGNQATASDTFILNGNAPSISIDTVADGNDVTPTISGTSDAPDGTLITVVITDSNNNSQTLNTTVIAGVWSVDAQDTLAEGEFTVNASITVNGLTSDAQATGIIDTLAPTFDIDPLSVTNDTTPTITGSSDEIGGLVSITVTDANGAVQTLTATVLADGTWSVDIPTPLAEGAFQVDASVTDVAGNTASDTENGGVIDTQAPTFDIDPLAATSDSTPTITGSSDEIGGLVSVIVTDATGAVQTLTATVLADGTWSVDVPTPLAEGTFQVDGSVTDAAGNTASDTENGGVIDTQAPTFDIDPLAATNDSTPTITGSSDEIGGLVSITVTDANGDIQTLTATVLADGSWSVDVPTPLAEGAFVVDASVTDAAGNTASDTENGGVIDTLAPTVDINPLADSNDSTPTITGSSDEIGGLVSITVTDANGDIQTLTATVLADGSWSVDVPTPLAEGAFVVDASVTDAAGNTASDTENGGVIDTLAPTFDIDPLAATNDSTPTITGSSDEIGGLVSITVTDANGDIQTLTATVLADGSWSVDVPTPLAEGAFVVDA